MTKNDLAQLMPLLAKRIKKYTSNDSSSIPYDKAKQLMGSILYCIHAATLDLEGVVSNPILSSANTLEDDFQIGLANIKKLLQITKLQYESIKKSFCFYGNTCYYDTIIKGMPEFFTHYNSEFDAENELLTLDYPLLHPLKDQRGILRIHDYLSHIQLEQLFLSAFHNSEIEDILFGYDEAYPELIINIPSIILVNALGCKLLKRSVTPLCIQDWERIQLKSLWTYLSPAKQKETLNNALIELLQEKYNSDSKLYQYLQNRIDSIASEFQICTTNNCMDRLFIDTKNLSKKPAFIFEDGISISDESLRKLIEEFKNCSLLSDKIILLKENAKSLSDLKELLEECFFLNEYEQVFQLLSKEEQHVLEEQILLKLEFDQKLYEWEDVFLDYLKNSKVKESSHPH